MVAQGRGEVGVGLGGNKGGKTVVRMENTNNNDNESFF